MQAVSKFGLRYYVFDSLAQAGLPHGVFTRLGGVSPSPWNSLNLGGTVGDDDLRVAENRQRLFRVLAREPESAYDVWQVHSAEVVSATAPRPPSRPHLRADAVLTNRPEVTLLMRFADCVPVVLYDPRRKAAGLVHAGWQGTVKRTAQAAVAAMREDFGTHPADLLAGIGPSIGAHHYPVGPEVAAEVRAAFGTQADSLLSEANSAIQFNLWEANRLVLEQAGVRQIEISGICTACHTDEWFSHRAEVGKTGRFGVLVGLPGA